MERGLRTLIKPVDDWCNISLNNIIIDRVLLPITFIEKPYMLTLEHNCVQAAEIKKGDMIWTPENNATDVMTELEEFGCEFKVTYSIEDDSLVGLFITKVPDEVTEND